MFGFGRKADKCIYWVIFLLVLYLWVGTPFYLGASLWMYHSWQYDDKETHSTLLCVFSIILALMFFISIDRQLQDKSFDKAISQKCLHAKSNDSQDICDLYFSERGVSKDHQDTLDALF